jgi:osmoprotectant transport system substrate-binding protein
VSHELTLGGPPECPQRPLCLIGLHRRYGIAFQRFIPLDSGGPLTLTALRAREIDVALLFSTDPGIAASNLVVLRDDRALQPAENVVPVVRRDLLSRSGPGLAGIINAVSARLTEDQLRLLDARLADGATPARVASAWLATQGLVPGGSG